MFVSETFRTLPLTQNVNKRYVVKSSEIIIDDILFIHFPGRQHNGKDNSGDLQCPTLSPRSVNNSWSGIGIEHTNIQYK